MRDRSLSTPIVNKLWTEVEDYAEDETSAGARRRLKELIESGIRDEFDRAVRTCFVGGISTRKVKAATEVAASRPRSCARSPSAPAVEPDDLEVPVGHTDRDAGKRRPLCLSRP